MTTLEHNRKRAAGEAAATAIEQLMEMDKPGSGRFIRKHRAVAYVEEIIRTRYEEAEAKKEA